MSLAVRHEEALQKTLGYLQRKDKSVVQILAKASHVWVLEFQEKDGAPATWVKLDLEGSLFLVKRDTAPFFRMTILNKSAAEHSHIDITPDFVCVNHKPHLQYMIYGVGAQSPICNIAFAKDQASMSSEASAQFDLLFEELQKAAEALRTPGLIAPTEQPTSPPLDVKAERDELDAFFDKRATVSDTAVQQRIARAANDINQNAASNSSAFDALVAQMARCPAAPESASTSTPTPPALLQQAVTSPLITPPKRAGGGSSTQSKLQALLASAQRGAGPLADAAQAPPEDPASALMRQLPGASAGPSATVPTAPALGVKPPAPDATAARDTRTGQSAQNAGVLDGLMTDAKQQAARAALRQACAALLQSDDVVDALLREMTRVGFKHAPT